MFENIWTWIGQLPPGNATFLGTLTGSSLGLIALLLGALFNARLNRKRDDALRIIDRGALAAALYAELQGVHRVLVENAKHLTDNPPDEGDGFIVPGPSIMILPEMLPKIGLLPPSVIRAVMDAYVLTEQYIERLILAGGEVKGNMPEGRPQVYMSSSWTKFVIRFNELRAEPVQLAINALIPYLPMSYE